MQLVFKCHKVLVTNYVFIIITQFLYRILPTVNVITINIIHYSCCIICYGLLILVQTRSVNCLETHTFMMRQMECLIKLLAILDIFVSILVLLPLFFKRLFVRNQVCSFYLLHFNSSLNKNLKLKYRISLKINKLH